ncbi:hypothetical protein GINT2_001537 [Glugoides intestinalis]
MILFSFLNLVQASIVYNQLALLVDETPITRASLNGMYVTETTIQKKTSFWVKEGEVNLEILSNPFWAEGVYTFLDNNSIFQKASFLRKDGEKFYQHGLETPVTPLSLSSLYFRELLLAKYKLDQKHVSINVSSRDYYTPEQSKDLATIFSSLLNTVKTIPESLAACIKNTEMIADEKEEKHLYVNFRGTAISASLYTIKRQGDKITIKAEELKSKIVTNLRSDEELKRELAQFIILSVKDRENVVFLPYERPEENRKDEEGERKYQYVDIKEKVSDIIKKLNENDSSVKKCNILELLVFETNEKDMHKKDDNRSGSILEKDVDLEAFRNFLNEKGELELNLDLPSDVKMFFISDFNRTHEKLAKFVRFPVKNLIDGLILAHTPKYNLEDSKIVFSPTISIPEETIELFDELGLQKSIFAGVLPKYENNKSKFSPKLKKELQELDNLISGDLTKRNILKIIDDKWVELNSKQNEIELDNALRDDTISELQKIIKLAEDILKNLKEDDLKDFKIYLAETIKLFDEKKETAEVYELIKRTNMLKAYINTVENLIKKREEELLQPAKEAEQNAQPESAEPEAANLQINDETLTEKDKDAQVQSNPPTAETSALQEDRKQEDDLKRDEIL